MTKRVKRERVTSTDMVRFMLTKIIFEVGVHDDG